MGEFNLEGHSLQLQWVNTTIMKLLSLILTAYYGIFKNVSAKIKVLVKENIIFYLDYS